MCQLCTNVLKIKVTPQRYPGTARIKKSQITYNFETVVFYACLIVGAQNHQFSFISSFAQKVFILMANSDTNPIISNWRTTRPYQDRIGFWNICSDRIRFRIERKVILFQIGSNKHFFRLDNFHIWISRFEWQITKTWHLILPECNYQLFWIT